jgi:hypothetical protein
MGFDIGDYYIAEMIVIHRDGSDPSDLVGSIGVSRIVDEDG